MDISQLTSAERVQLEELQEYADWQLNHNIAKVFIAFNAYDGDKKEETIKMLIDISRMFGCSIRSLAQLYLNTNIYGRLSREDCNRFHALGIPLLHELAKTAGVDKADMIAKLMEDEVKFKLVETALFSYNRENKAYATKHIKQKSNTAMVAQYLSFRLGAKMRIYLKDLVKLKEAIYGLIWQINYRLKKWVSKFF